MTALAAMGSLHMKSRNHPNKKALVEVSLCGERVELQYHLWELHTEQKHSDAHLLAHNDNDTMAALIYTHRCSRTAKKGAI